MQVGVGPKGSLVALDRDLKGQPGHVNNAAALVALVALRPSRAVLDDADEAVLTPDNDGSRPVRLTVDQHLDQVANLKVEDQRRDGVGNRHGIPQVKTLLESRALNGYAGTFHVNL